MAHRGPVAQPASELPRGLRRAVGERLAVAPRRLALAIRRHPPEQWAPATRAFMAACEEAGFPRDPDMNAPGSIGYGALPMNSVGGTRFNTALAYLAPQRECSNLDILPSANVISLMLTGRRATGIRAEHDGRTIELHGGEIVLSAGAVKSPHLLMLSGIGPAEELRAAGIDVVLDSPHVGRNFTDHCTIHFPLRVPGLKRGKFDPTTMALSEAGLHYTADGSAEHSDMMLMATTVPLNVSLLQTSSLWQQLRMLALATRQMSWAKLKEQLLSEWDLGIMVILMQGRSRGEADGGTVPVTAMVTVDAHRLQQARPARPGRPHRDGRDRVVLIVVPHQAASPLVCRRLRHRLPPLGGERRPLKGSPLHRNPVADPLGPDDFHS